MAHECQDLSTRMAAVDQTIIERLIYETTLTHFKSHKVEISDAIKTAFPFLEILRDRGFITKELFNESEKAWKNLSPVPKVVYDVLSELEKSFDMSLMKILFSKVIMKNYPDLNEVREDFRNAVQEKICFPEETGENWNQNLTWLFPEPLNYKEQLCEVEQIDAVETGTTSDTDAPESQQASEQRAQASEPAVEPPDHGIPGNSCSAELMHIKTEKPFVQSGINVEAGARSNCNPASDTIVILSEDSAESGDGDETPEAFTSAVKRRPESTDSRIPPTSGKKLCKRKRSHEESPKPSANQAPPGARGSAVKTGPAGEGKDCGPRAPGQQESEFRAPVSLSAHTAPAAIPASISGTVNPGNNSTLEKAKKKRRSTNQETESVDFNSEILPVKCGKTDGSLYKNKLEQGATVKCIKSDDGNWFTPREFEIKGGREKSSNWKLSIRCGGETLKRLMDRGYLPKPPSKNNGKKKLRKSNTCEICRSRGTLFRCDTCSRSFHKGCHLPSVEKKSSPWSCTFCQIMLSAGSQQCRRESEVLARPMGPEEELKCKFLFLKVCCHFDENFPKKNQVATVRRVEALMMLKAIRKKLNERRYPQVEGFVRELRGVFQHSGAPANSNDVGLMKGRLEVKFEQNFKKVFAIQEIKEEPTDN
ncbi:nuclear body protein SP140-like protein isoform X3 [Saccopteryx leptura]|uniref:nuclear body protein SP140-like protein isoform X3 n=1 Tax=Saccopteryx leptura TaxID=249018 RepID=UPI00339D099F